MKAVLACLPVKWCEPALLEDYKLGDVSFCRMIGLETQRQTDAWRLYFLTEDWHSNNTKICIGVYQDSESLGLKSRDIRDLRQTEDALFNLETILHPLCWQTRVSSRV